MSFPLRYQSEPRQNHKKQNDPEIKIGTLSEKKVEKQERRQTQ